MSARSPAEELQPYADFAFVEFGMSSEEFFAQTPLQWDGIMQAWLNRERRADRRVARVCAVLTGASEEDFMPRVVTEEDEQTIDEMLVVLQAVAPKSQNG